MNVHFSWLCIRIYIKNYFQLHWKCIDDIVNQKSSSDIFGTLFHFISRRMAKQIISVRFVILSILFSAFFLKKRKYFTFFETELSLMKSFWVFTGILKTFEFTSSNVYMLFWKIRLCIGCVWVDEVAFSFLICYIVVCSFSWLPFSVTINPYTT